MVSTTLGWILPDSLQVKESGLDAVTILQVNSQALASLSLKGLVGIDWPEIKPRV